LVLLRYFIILAGTLVALAGNAHSQDPSVPTPRDRIQVSHVLFDGNFTYSDVVLREVIATEQPGAFQRLRMKSKQRWFLDTEEVQRDVIRLERFYRRRGFTEPVIAYKIEEGKKSWQRKVTFSIREGPFIETERISILWDTDSLTADNLGNSPDFVRAMRRLPLKQGQRYEPILEPESAGYLNAVVRNRGYAFSQTLVTADVDSISNRSRIEFVIKPGPETRFDSILVEGNTTAIDSRILKEAVLRPGDPFSQRRLDNAQLQLYSHHLIRFVTVGLPDQPVDSTVTVSIRLREHPLRKVEVLGGVGNRELLRTQVSWIHRNPFGMMHSFGVSGRVTFISQRMNMDYTMPYVGNTNSSVIVSPFAERRLEQAYRLRRGGIRNSYIYQYGYKFTSTLAYTFSGNKVDVFNERATLPDDVEQYTISALELSALYADELFTVQRGWVVRPSLELSGFFNSGDYTYQKLYLDARRYVDVTPKVQLALRGVGGFIFGAMADSLPPSIQFYSGGYGSVRGWYENQLGPKRPLFDEDGEFDRFVPTGGRYMMQFSGEARFRLDRLIPQLGISSFVDSGQVWKKWPGFPNSEDRAFQVGVGGGVYYVTPVGPVRFDVAYKVNPNDDDLNILEDVDYGKPIDRWGFHFSLGHSF
jgi:outer membrane protein insertion porin family